jgi:hypothetical protein
MAARREYVPAGPFRRIIEERIEQLKEIEILNPTEAVATDIGVTPRRIWALRDERQKTVEFRTADRIVTYLHPDGPFAWHNDPELNEIYMAVDLTEENDRRSRARTTTSFHGTRSRYNFGCRCEPCKDANRAYRAQYEAGRPDRRKKVAA